MATLPPLSDEDAGAEAPATAPRMPVDTQFDVSATTARTAAMARTAARERMRLVAAPMSNGYGSDTASHSHMTIL